LRQLILRTYDDDKSRLCRRCSLGFHALEAPHRGGHISDSGPYLDFSRRLRSENRFMNKKQFIAVSFVAAVPAAALLVFLVLGLLQGMLSDGATVSPVLWIVWVLAALGALSMAFLPFAIMFFPGLMPDPALATAAAAASGLAAAPGKKSSQPAEADGYEEGEEEFSEDTEAAEDDGEQLFDDGAMEDSYDDEYEDFEDSK
jgi:hypothetical protein